MLVRRQADLMAPASIIDRIDSSHEQSDDYAGAAEQVDLRWYLSAIYRRRWMAAAVAILTLASAAFYAFTATEVYEARAKLLIDTENPNVVSFKEVIEQNMSKLDYYQTQLGILRSRTLARKTLDSLGLWSHPEFQRRPPNAIDRLGASAAAVLARLSGHRVESASPAPAAGETTDQSHVVDAFLSRLTISYRADNRLFDLGFQSTDPQVAATVANAVARVYIEQTLALKFRASKDASDWLNARLAEQRTQVEASEMALQRYREENGDVSLSEQQNTTVQKLSDFSSAATHARTEHIELEALYKQLRLLQEDPAAADTLPMSVSTAAFQQLKAELGSLEREENRLAEMLGELHPDLVRVRSSMQRVREQLRGEVARIAESVRTQLLAVDAKEQKLGSALNQQEHVALALNRRSIQFGALQREATTTRQIFEALLERAKQTEISSALKTTNIQIVDPAEVPREHAWPQRRLILLAALIIGVPLGAALVLALEYFDDRIKSPDDIRASLGVKFLGFAPTLPGKQVLTHLPQTVDTLPRAFAEAVRMIRANLFLASSHTATKTVLVTSTRAGEGKTSVATTLAVALAHARRRVLLIDADMRRQQVHKIFDASLTPGLSAVLQGTVPITDALKSTAVPGLWILTAGESPEQPADLLELPVFAQALAAVHDRFDWVVIDSPPVASTSDAISLARVATAVIFVVGAKMTGRAEAQLALEQLEAAETRIAGAVLARANAEDCARGYGYYH